jgi:hypothetical protein
MNLSLCREENIRKHFPGKVESNGDDGDEKYGKPGNRSCTHYMRSHSHHIEVFAGTSVFSDHLILVKGKLDVPGELIAAINNKQLTW